MKNLTADQVIDRARALLAVIEDETGVKLNTALALHEALQAYDDTRDRAAFKAICRVPGKFTCGNMVNGMHCGRCDD
jgi:hypothetical protein